MNIQTLNQTIKTLEGVRNAVGSFTRADVDLTLGLLRREVEAQTEHMSATPEQVAEMHELVGLVLADWKNLPQDFRSRCDALKAAIPQESFKALLISTLKELHYYP